jgi:hypothetical protein
VSVACSHSKSILTSYIPGKHNYNYLNNLIKKSSGAVRFNLCNYLLQNLKSTWLTLAIKSSQFLVLLFPLLFGFTDKINKTEKIHSLELHNLILHMKIKILRVYIKQEEMKEMCCRSGR